MWVWFLIYGIIIAFVIWVAQRRKWRWKRWPIILMLALLLSLVFYFNWGETFLGDDSWYNQNPYIHIIFFLLMLFGMAVRYITKAVEDRRAKIRKLEQKMGDKEFKKPGLVFDPVEFCYPFLLSIITYGSLWSQLDIKVVTISNIVLSFQAGFFWQTVLKK